LVLLLVQVRVLLLSQLLVPPLSLS